MMNIKFVRVVTAILLLLMTSQGIASSTQRLTVEQIDRLKEIRSMVQEVDNKTLEASIKELEKTSNPLMNLSIKEAMAKSYLDIIKEQNVVGKGKRQWLYSMIALNMAYLQFAGQKDSAGGSKNLNKLIRFKLKTYLPANIYKQPGFHCSVG